MARKNDILSIYTKEVEDIKAAGLFKGEVPIVSPQSAKVQLEDGRTVINMCANNYLGLGDNQRLIDAAKRTYDERGYGVASVRFICGTQDIHKQLEKKISGFLGTDDTILYSSCFDANGGLFETILTADDAVISDELNHASIIDGVRLCKAKRFRYKNNDMADLEAKLKEADEAGARIKHGRYHLQPEGCLRPGRQIQCSGYGRRQPCSWFRRQTWSWYRRALRCRGSC